MKKFSQEKYEYILPIICSIIYFLAIKNIIPNLFYAVFAILVSLYFFPLKLILKNNSTEDYDKNNLMRIISFIIISIISALSIIILINNNLDLRYIFKVLSIINVFLLIYFYIKKYNKSTLLTHFGFIIFTSAIIGI